MAKINFDGSDDHIKIPLKSNKDKMGKNMSLCQTLKKNITEKQKIIDLVISENIRLKQTLEKCSAFVRYVHREADLMLSDYDLLDEIEAHFSRGVNL